MFAIPAADDPDGPWAIFAGLLNTHEELGELQNLLDEGILLAFMMRAGEWGRNQRTTLGTCYCQPSAQGDLRPLFEQLLEDTLGFYPDFLIILNADWWADATPAEREVLVFHEALHACHARDKEGTLRYNRQTGMPIPGIRPHDVEEFTAVARRYGGWKTDLAEFLAAAAEGRNSHPPPAAGADVF